MNKKRIITTSLLALLSVFCIATNVHAGTGGWVGGGDVGGGFGGAGGSGTGGGCTDGDNGKYYLHCTGYSWLYFEYQGGHSGSFTLPMGINASSVYIDGTCAQVGGFYHLGRNAQAFGYHGFADYTNLKGKGHELRAPYTYKGSSGSWGHMQTYTWGQISTHEAVDYKVKTPVYQDIYYNDTVIYSATHMASEDEAFAAFKQAYQYVNGTAWTDSSFPSDTYAFCYDEDLMATSTFSGVTEAKVTTSPTMNDGTYEVKFTHQIKRTSGSDSSTTHTVAHNEGNSGWVNESGYVNRTMSGITTNYNQTAKATTYEDGWLDYGQSIEVCGRNVFVSNSSTGSTSTSSDCVTVSRPNPSADFNAKTEMSGDNGDVPGGDWKVNFRHYLRRSGGDEWNGGNEWETHVSGGGSSKSGTWTGTSSSWTRVASDTASGHLNPGMSKNNICQYISYHVTVDGEGGGGASGDSTRQCASVSRKEGFFTGDLTVKVNGVAKNNGNTIELGKNASAEIQFVGKITRDYDGSGGELADDYKVDATGQGGTDVAWSTTSAMSEGETVTAYSQTFDVDVLPDENVQICQTFYWDTNYYNTGSRTPDSETICITLHRDKEECDIDSSNVFGVYSGKNVGELAMWRNSQTFTMSMLKYSDSGTQEKTFYAKPGDTIGFKHSVCAGAQMSRDYYSVDTATTYSANAAHYNVDAGATTNNTFMFGTPTSWTFKFGRDGIKNNVSNYIASANSPTVKRSSTNGYRCNDSVGDYRYQVTGSNNVNSCNSTKLTGVASNVGKVIQQKLSWRYVETSYGSDYNAKNVNLTAKIAVPYNYDTRVQSTNVSNKPVSAGTTATVDFKIDILSRNNSLVQTDAYSTHTKPSTIKGYWWTENRDTSAATIKNKILNSYGGRETTNGYFTTRDPSSGKNIIYTSTKSYTANDGETVSIDIPISANATIGQKICYAVAIYPSDSHGNPGHTNVGELDQSNALKEGGTGWHSSKASCFTVGKKPTMAVINGGLYAQNGIKTSTTTRNVGGTNYLFGSWTEFVATSNAPIIGMSSGAATWGGNPNFGLGTKECRFSPLTIANSNCNSSKTLGSSTSSALDSSSAARNIVDQMITRYTSNHHNDLASQGENVRVDIWGACIYDSDAGTYIPYGTTDDSNYTCLPNGSGYVYSSKTLSFSPTGASHSYWYMPMTNDGFETRTFVIHGKNVIIDEDLTYGFLNYEGSGYYHKGSVFNTVGSIPQFIIIADESITIGEDVTNIDAWLVAPNIDTCAYDRYGNKFNQTTNRIDATHCNKTLYLNGPVYANNLSLNRTAGGGGYTYIRNSPTSWTRTYVSSSNNKKANATPGEVFNISPEVYYWTFHEATRFSQATTTYQRELPTRY